MFAQNLGISAQKIRQIKNTDDEIVINDANGNPLKNCYNMTVLKNLKVKGSTLVVKVDTKLKIIAWSMAFMISIV